MVHLITTWLLLILLCAASYMPQAHALDGMTVNKTLPLEGRIAFSATISGDQKIVLVDVKTGTSSVLIDGPTNDWSPVFHPGGKELVFISDRANRPYLYTANTQGGNVRRVNTGSAAIGNPDWNKDPNSRTLYYYKENKGPKNTNLYSYDLDGRKELRLTNFEGRNSTPRVSPDGQRLAFSTNRFWPGWDVCLYHIRQRTTRCVLKGIDSYCRPTWRKDGKAVLYSVGSGDAITLGEFTIASSYKRPLSTLRGRNYDARYVSDESILFANDQNGTYDLYLQNKKGTFPIVEAPYDLRYPTWHPTSVMEQEIERTKLKTPGSS